MSFPTLLVSDIAGRALSALPANSPITLTPSKEASKVAWDEIRRLRDASAWPREKPERQSMFKTLVSNNAGFVDRLSALRQSFSRVSGEEVGLGGHDGAGAAAEL